jgi:hypothetical protein
MPFIDWHIRSKSSEEQSMPSIFSNPRDVTHSLAPPLFPLAAHLQRLRQLRPEVCHLRWRYARELYVCMCSTNAVDFG